jgi:predicted acetyltransferase
MSRSAPEGGILAGLPGLAIDAARTEERGLVENLTQLYVHDFSALFAGTQRLDLGQDGRFQLDPPFDATWQVDDHLTLLLRWHGHPAGFALINRHSHMAAPTDNAIAEYFVVRKYRRLGIGIAAARAIFTAWPGQWEVAVMRANIGAIAFWDEAIRGCPNADKLVVDDRSDGDWTGPVFRFVIAP